MVKFDPNGLFYFMAKLMSENYFSIEEKDRVCIRIRNEGSSRSSKTFDFFHLLVWILSNNPNSGIATYIYRDTLTNCRDFTLKDFQECLRVMGIYDPSKLRNYSQKPEYNLYGNMVYFRGLEEDIEYPPCHIIFFNEAMEISEAAYKAASKRCSMLDVADWNPKFTDHWIFKHEGQPNTWFTHTDYRNNKHIDPALVKKFESWCPWEFEDLDLPEAKRRVNKVNQQNRTIDRVQWLIYGRGIRCAMEGLIFGGKEIPVTYVDSAPVEYEARYFGLDFGNTTGTWAFTDNRKTQEGIVYDCPIYGSFQNASEFFEVFKTYYAKAYKDSQWQVICDSANPQYINDLNAYASATGLNAVFLPCKKFEGCVEWRIGLMKRNGVILVNRSWIRSEQENYFWDSVNGIQLQKAKKNGHDHFFDSAGMSIQYEIDLR
jgi:hypothetical protein